MSYYDKLREQQAELNSRIESVMKIKEDEILERLSRLELSINLIFKPLLNRKPVNINEIIKLNNELEKMIAKTDI